MISGTFVLTDQISGAFDNIFQAANKGTDAVVKPSPAFGSENDGNDVPLYVPESLVARVKQRAGRARGRRRDAPRAASSSLDGKLVKPTGGAPPILASEAPDFRVSTLARRVASRARRARRAPDLAVDKRLADRKHLKVGQQVQVATATGLHPARVSGIIKFPASIGRRDAS